MNLIAAIDLNRCIGKNGELLFHIKKDLNHFKELTLNKVVVMGRKTWESLPNAPLLNRINVVITKNPNFIPKDKKVLVFYSPEEAERFLLKVFRSEDIFIIGGESIYKYFMDKCDKFYITQIYDRVEDGDRFLPKIPFDENQWDIKIGEIQIENGIKFSFEEYTKTSKKINCSINKEIFCELIEKIKEQFEKNLKLSDALHAYDKESYFYPSGIESYVIDFLEKLLKDEEGWINYFIYELDFGDNYKKGMVKIDEKDYELKNSEQLYELILSNSNKKGEV